MGELIRFPVEKVQRSAGKVENSDTPAKVLMFEGVRYSTLECESRNQRKPAAKPKTR